MRNERNKMLKKLKKIVIGHDLQFEFIERWASNEEIQNILTDLKKIKK